MTSLQTKIVEAFLAQLASSPDVDAAQVEQLGGLLAENKNPRPDDLVKIFSLPVDAPIE